MFNYQIVFKNEDDERIIFAGVTESTIDLLLANKGEIVPLSYEVESILFQPVNSQENEQTKK